VGDLLKAFTVIGHQVPKRGGAKAHRPIEHRLEYGAKIPWRGIDNAQDFCGRRLLFQRLSGFGDEARVFHRDHGLRREVLQ
jgi:hypothetical protein